MYISVENYREMYLNGKDAKTVLGEIEKIRREMAKIKAKLESPANAYDSYTYASDCALIDVLSDYLTAARESLAEISESGLDYTEEEKASLIFDSLVDSIERLTLTVGKYFEDKYELIFDGERATLVKTLSGKDAAALDVDCAAAKEKIRALRMGEWKESYSPDQYGCAINEPTKWQIRLDYSGKTAPRFYDGVGVFPYNFNVLSRLLGAEIL